MRIVEMWRCEGSDENAGTGDRSGMRKQGIGKNTGTGDRSATDIFTGYRRGYYGPRLVDREPYDNDEDIFGGIIVERVGVGLRRRS